MGLKLIIANKKYSSWSLRPWLVMKVLDVDFEEILPPFDMSTIEARTHYQEWAQAGKEESWVVSEVER